MNSITKMSGITLASAAATLLLAGCSGTSTETSAAPAMAKTVANVKCSGINSCKGTSACATATTSCKGQNSCKGSGWVKATAADCSAKGGKNLGKA